MKKIIKRFKAQSFIWYSLNAIALLVLFISGWSNSGNWTIGIINDIFWILFVLITVICL